MRRWMSALSLVVVSLALVACAPGDFDSGTAQLTLTAGDEAPLDLVHAPGLSTVRLTPPVDGEMELSFSYNDPLVDLTLRTDANQVTEGEVVPLPAAPEKLSLRVVYEDVTYDSGEGSSGSVELQVLFVDEATGAAQVSAVIEATLVAITGDELAVDGVVEGSVEGDDGA